MPRKATGTVRKLKKDGKHAWYGRWTRADGTRSDWLPLPGNIPLNDEAAAKVETIVEKRGVSIAGRTIGFA